MNKIGIICLQIGVLVLFATGGVLAGYHYGAKDGKGKGEEAGYSIGYNKGLKDNTSDETLKKAEDAYYSLYYDYNDLVDDYNNLRDAAIQYVGANSYNSKQRISCTSNTYGYFSPTTYTNCY